LEKKYEAREQTKNLLMIQRFEVALVAAENTAKVHFDLLT
jgi:hypothetical protein